MKSLPCLSQEGIIQSNVAVGRAVAVLTGERSRIYELAVRSFEIQNAKTKDRLTVDIQSDDERCILPLAPGNYELIRVQINEGPFLSIAQLASTCSIGQEPITYVVTWRSGVDSPKYGRMVSVSIVNDEEDRAEALHTLATALPVPSEVQTRLYEVMPYPGIPRYFRRHWW